MKLEKKFFFFNSNLNFFFVSVLVIIFFLSFLINKILFKLEYNLKQKYSKIGEAFLIKPFGRFWCIYSLLSILFIDLFLFLAGLNSEKTKISLDAGMDVPLLLLPAMIFCLYMIIHNSGLIVLTKNEIILIRLGVKKFLQYNDIVGIKDRNFSLMPNLILEGSNRNLRIPVLVENYTLLYKTIQDRIPKKEIHFSFPYNLKITKKAYIFTFFGIIVLLVFYIIIGSSGIWVSWLDKKIISFTGLIINSVIASIIFIPTIVLFIVYSIDKNTPIEFILNSDTVRFRYPSSHWDEWTVKELSKIYLKPEIVHLSRGFENIESALVLEWTDNRKLTIGKDRARQFVFTVEGLYRLFYNLYMKNVLEKKDG